MRIVAALTPKSYLRAIVLDLYNIDNSDITQILGTIAGDDTIFLVKKKGITEEEIINALSVVIPELSLHD